MLETAVMRNDVKSKIESDDFVDEMVSTKAFVLGDVSAMSRPLRNELLLVVTLPSRDVSFDALEAVSKLPESVACSAKGVSVVTTHILEDTRATAAIPPNLKVVACSVVCCC